MAERQQRRALLELRRAAVGVREHPERAQLLLDEEGDVVAAHPPAEALRDDIRDRLDVALAVTRLGDQVEQLRELDDLAVGAARQQRRLPEARVLELPDQLDAVRELGRLRDGRRGGDVSLEAHRRRSMPARYWPVSSPCSIVEVWSASALALPSMFWTMTES